MGLKSLPVDRNWSRRVWAKRYQTVVNQRKTINGMMRLARSAGYTLGYMDFPDHDKNIFIFKEAIIGY